MKILNFGSTNIDIIFSVDHIVLPGETISSTDYKRSLGGKGANQSAAVAKAGITEIYHAGRIGEDGLFIKETLEKMGVNTQFLEVGTTATGQALIQVASDGQNSIVLYAGANKEFTESYVDSVLTHFESGDWLILQNEINLLDYIITQAHKKGMKICFNPAPFDHSVLSLPLQHIDVLVVNEVEAQGLSNEDDPLVALERLTTLYPNSSIVITLGKMGVRYAKGTERHQFGVWDVPVVDTTAAGDTFIGFYVASIANNESVEEALYRASGASSITVMRSGAMEAIPTLDELSLLQEYTLS